MRKIDGQKNLNHAAFNWYLSSLKKKPIIFQDVPFILENTNPRGRGVLADPPWLPVSIVIWTPDYLFHTQVWSHCPLKSALVHGLHVTFPLFHLKLVLSNKGVFYLITAYLMLLATTFSGILSIVFKSTVSRDILESIKLNQYFLFSRLWFLLFFRLGL